EDEEKAEGQLTQLPFFHSDASMSDPDQTPKKLRHCVVLQGGSFSFILLLAVPLRYLAKALTIFLIGESILLFNYLSVRIYH
ncbi:MAG: hypothetical protein HN584_13345, partial [Akkermansiaceae bacterium]|nr:hypothetical protein [Akkermansiaceae bacterium]